MSKKYFVVSDIHGFYTLMKEALDEAGFDINNPEHIFISAGDLLDRGKQPFKCLIFVNSIPDDRKFLIKGNHESLYRECCIRHEFLRHDYHNGTAETVMDLCSGSCTDAEEVFDSALSNPEWVKYERSLVDYAEIGKHIFVHGWIPTKLADNPDPKFTGLPELYRPKIDVKDKNWRKGDWESARWKNGMAMWDKGIKLRGKTIVCGHFHTSWGHHHLHNICSEFGADADFSIFKDKGIIAIDACTAYSKKVNVLVIDEEEM